jgi:hypothetical protein
LPAVIYLMPKRRVTWHSLASAKPSPDIICPTPEPHLLGGRASYIRKSWNELDSLTCLHWFISQKHPNHVKALSAAEGSYRRGVGTPQHPPRFTKDPLRLRAVTERSSIEERGHCVLAYDICKSYHINAMIHSAQLWLIPKRTDSDHDDDEFPRSPDTALPPCNLCPRR